jgi:hypothetical protein
MKDFEVINLEDWDSSRALTHLMQRYPTVLAWETVGVRVQGLLQAEGDLDIVPTHARATCREPNKGPPHG